MSGSELAHGTLRSTNGAVGTAVVDVDLVTLPIALTQPDLQQSSAAAVGDDRERIALRINDEIIRHLFGLGLHLQGTAELVDGQARVRLNVAVGVLDATIVELRKAIFAVVASVPTSGDSRRHRPDSRTRSAFRMRG